MTTTTIIRDVMQMDRATLEAACVAEGVAKWGDGERGGVVAQARKKSLGTLQIEHAIRLAEAAGVPEVEIRRMELPGKTERVYQAIGNMDDGGAT